MNGLDAYHATRNLIESSFNHLTWYEDACTQCGFKGISQIWKEEPAWYFWMNQIDGTFLLRLHAEEPLADNQFISLSLHYFPDPDEEAYQTLSAGEKRLLSDENSFDQKTNSPQFETYEQFVSMFVVAEVGFVIDPDNQLRVLLYSSELPSEHPSRTFLDLLVTALNFQSKQHHQRIFTLQDGTVNTLILVYSAPVFQSFLQEFGLKEERLKDLSLDERFADWKQAAHMDVVCSMSGTCSCHH